MTTSDLSNKSAEELIGNLVTWINNLRNHLEDLPEVAKVIVLIYDFEAHVKDRGLLWYLETGLGRFFPEPLIQAFGTIRAEQTHDILKRINRIMLRHGVTTDQLSLDIGALDIAGASSYVNEKWDISQFLNLHGEHLRQMVEEIQKEQGGLFVFDYKGEKVHALLTAYAEQHRTELIRALNEFHSQQTARRG